MSESQEQRLARLAELAKKAWPHLRDVAALDGSDVDGSAQIVARSAFPATTFDGTPFADDYVTTVMCVPGRAASGARAIDALEAALCILAGEPTAHGVTLDAELYAKHAKLVEVADKLRAERSRADKAEHELTERKRSHALQLDAMQAQIRALSVPIEYALARLAPPVVVVHNDKAELELAELRARLGDLLAGFRMNCAGLRERCGDDDAADAFEECADKLDGALKGGKHV